jgi:uncharacterized membrane protein YdjX (TVP38/TMEM64 family)
MGFLQTWRFWKWALIVVFAVGLLVGARLVPTRVWLETFVQWAEQQGAAGMLFYTAVYTVAIVLCLWGTPFTLAAGVGFGVWWGALISTFSATAGSGLAFLIARYLARDAIARRVESDERFRAIDHAIGERGWLIVFLTRFSPIIPFSLSNYLFGLTRVRFWSFIGASFLAILPGSLLVAYLGHMGRLAVLDGFGAVGWWEYLLMGGGIIFTLGILLYLARIARAAVTELDLRKAREQNPVV